MGPNLHLEEEEADTGHVCANCEDDLAYTAEVFLLQIAQPKITGGATFYFPVIDENDPAGDFLFEPFIYCFDCWETLYQELKKDTDDVPPVQDRLSAFECTCCGSSIREWEYAGTFTLGELHPSNRAPSNVLGPRFVQNVKAEILCLYCLSVLNDNYIEMWDELSQFGECSDCLLARCWRHEQSCGCGCHETTKERTT